MASLTGVEVLHFMPMTCQLERSAINAVNQYCWQLLLRLLLNNSQLTPPICLTFTSFDTHTPDWGVQTDTHTPVHTAAHTCCSHRGVAHKRSPVCEHRTTVLRMMGCLLRGVMNLYPPSASLKDSRITVCCNRVDSSQCTHAHTVATSSFSCLNMGFYFSILGPLEHIYQGLLYC